MSMFSQKSESERIVSDMEYGEPNEARSIIETLSLQPHADGGWGTTGWCAKAATTENTGVPFETSMISPGNGAIPPPDLRWHRHRTASILPPVSPRR